MYQKLEPVKATFKLSCLLSESDSDSGDKLTDVLEYIGAITGVDRVYLGLWRNSGKTITTAVQWCIEPLDPMPENPVAIDDVALLDEYFRQNSGMFSVQRELLISDHSLVGVLCLESRYANTSLNADEQKFLAAAVQLLAPFLSKLSLSTVSPAAEAEVSPGEASTEKSVENAPTVLIVEDNIINQNSLSRIWQHLGVHTQLADDGFEALTLCRERRFDLILMDLSMPGKDGFDTCREILTSCPNNQNTPIVAVTANVGDGVEARCLKVGMTEYVSKPIRLDRVRELAEHYLSI